MPDTAQMRAVVEDDGLFAVVHVKIIRHHMFAEHEAVAEPLSRHVPEHIVVVLVARGDQARGMARIRQQMFSRFMIADIVGQTELAVLDIDPGDVLQIRRALGRIHDIGIQFRAEFEVADRKHDSAEFASERSAFHTSQQGPRPGLGIMFLRGIPVGKDPRIVGPHLE